jgi:hypothetical protein
MRQVLHTLNAPPMKKYADTMANSAAGIDASGKDTYARAEMDALETLTQLMADGRAPAAETSVSWVFPSAKCQEMFDHANQDKKPKPVRPPRHGAVGPAALRPAEGPSCVAISTEEAQRWILRENLVSGQHRESMPPAYAKALLNDPTFQPGPRPRTFDPAATNTWVFKESANTAEEVRLNRARRNGKTPMRADRWHSSGGKKSSRDLPAGAFLSSPSRPGNGLMPSRSPYNRHAILVARGDSAAEARTARSRTGDPAAVRRDRAEREGHLRLQLLLQPAGGRGPGAVGGHHGDALSRGRAPE